MRGGHIFLIIIISTLLLVAPALAYEWETMESGTEAPLYSIDFVDNDGWAAGGYGLVYYDITI